MADDEQKMPQGQASGYNPKSLENLSAPKYQPGQSGNPGGMPKGSSILGPVLRQLAANKNEHGEGAGAVEMAGDLMRGAHALACGVDKEIKIDVGPIFKLMERTDPQIKEARLHITDDNGAVPLE